MTDQLQFDMEKSVAVVIPVKNGFPEIKDCIEGLLKQTFPISRIIAIDSGSTDGTVEYLRTVEKVEVHSIDASSFNHGLTRNLGLVFSSESFLYYTVQDARAISERLIEDFLDCFEDEDVMAVCGQQVVDKNLSKNPIDWFFPVSEPTKIIYQYGRKEEFERLSPKEKAGVCGWDNVNAFYRRSALESIPFDEAVFGEDMLWAKKAYLKGFKLAFWYRARVFHYHLENSTITYKRTYTETYFRYKAFGLVPEPSKIGISEKFQILKTLVKRLWFSWNDITKWYSYNIEVRTAANDAVAAFIDALTKGDEFLDAEHERICGKPPVPLKQLLG
ncbi:MAG: glycosyltransferase [Chitinophagaceae bacterium]|nr:glycosyltransferase [Chitinophagaceae bacterium]